MARRVCSWFQSTRTWEKYPFGIFFTPTKGLRDQSVIQEGFSGYSQLPTFLFQIFTKLSVMPLNYSPQKSQKSVKAWKIKGFLSLFKHLHCIMCVQHASHCCLVFSWDNLRLLTFIICWLEKMNARIHKCKCRSSKHTNSSVDLLFHSIFCKLMWIVI